MKTRRLRGQIGYVVERHEDAIVICLGEHVAADHRHIHALRSPWTDSLAHLKSSSCGPP